jgi:hypothetical protein
MNFSVVFWKDSIRWKRASVNTARCLLGCSLGDFGALFTLQALNAPFSPHTTMAIAITSGLITSYGIEVGYLMRKEGLTLSKARETALKMSLVSMVSMEIVETSVDLMLTQGRLDVSDPFWWTSLGISLAAGFVTPLPYNYYMLKKYGKCCH